MSFYYVDEDLGKLKREDRSGGDLDDHVKLGSARQVNRRQKLES